MKDKFPTADTLQDTASCAGSPFNCSIFNCMKVLIYSM